MYRRQLNCHDLSNLSPGTLFESNGHEYVKLDLSLKESAAWFANTKNGNIVNVTELANWSVQATISIVVLCCKRKIRNSV